MKRSESRLLPVLLTAGSLLPVGASLADSTAPCNNGFEETSTECGEDSDTSTAVEATAIGVLAVAQGYWSVAVGNGARTLHNGSTVVGASSSSSDTFSTVVGYDARSHAARAVAIGYSASVSAPSSVALGPSAFVGSGYTNATAIGANAYVAQSNSLVLGSIESSFVDVGIGTAIPEAPLHISRDAGSSIDLEQTDTSSTWSLIHKAGVSGAFLLDHTDGGGPDGEEFALQPNGNVRIAGTLAVTSDKNAKQDIQPVTGDLVLAKLEGLPVAEWSYKTDVKTRHIGPMAQDFHNAFSLGNSDRHISPTDMAGVNMAAIKALKAEKDAEIVRKNMEILALKAEKDAEIASLREQNQLILKRLAELEARPADE